MPKRYYINRGRGFPVVSAPKRAEFRKAGAVRLVYAVRSGPDQPSISKITTDYWAGAGIGVIGCDG